MAVVLAVGGLGLVASQPGVPGPPGAGSPVDGSPGIPARVLASYGAAYEQTATPATTPGAATVLAPTAPKPTRPAATPTSGTSSCEAVLPTATTAEVVGAPVTGVEVVGASRDLRCRHRTAAGAVTLRIERTVDAAAARALATTRTPAGSTASTALPGARVGDGPAGRSLVAARGASVVTLTVPATVSDAGLATLLAALRGRSVP